MLCLVIILVVQSIVAIYSGTVPIGSILFLHLSHSVINSGICALYAGSFDGLENAVNTEDISGGFVVYAYKSHLSAEEFIERVSDYIPISD